MVQLLELYVNQTGHIYIFPHFHWENELPYLKLRTAISLVLDKNLEVPQKKPHLTVFRRTVACGYFCIQLTR